MARALALCALPGERVGTAPASPGREGSLGGAPFIETVPVQVTERPGSGGRRELA